MTLFKQKGAQWKNIDDLNLTDDEYNERKNLLIPLTSMQNITKRRCKTCKTLISITACQWIEKYDPYNCSLTYWTHSSHHIEWNAYKIWASIDTLWWLSSLEKQINPKISKKNVSSRISLTMTINKKPLLTI